MSDGEHDTLERQLKGMVIAQAPPRLHRRAHRAHLSRLRPGDRIPHVHPMRSIENIYTYEDLVAWAEKLG